MITFKDEIVEVKKLVFPKDYSPNPEKLAEVQDSIKRQGLFHPPIIKDNFEIVAGKVRVRACDNIGAVKIQVKVVPSNLEPDEYTSISLEENLKRGNLQWDEIVIKEKEFHELRQRQVGMNPDEAGRGKRSSWGIRETAAELQIALGTLSEDLNLASAIMLDPSLRRIKDKTTAKRVMNENIKRSQQELGANRPVNNIETNICHCGSSEVILQMFDDNTFDACITDPPWLEFRDPSLRRDEFTLPVFKEVFRVLKANSFLYMFVSTQDWHFYWEELAKIGFSIQKWPLIWVKEAHLSHGRRVWEYQRDFEPILLAVKGSPALTDGMLSSVISNKIVPPNTMIHPNEKPVQLPSRLLTHCTYDGALVLDPFAGSGAMLVACKQTGRRFVGIEKDSKYFMKIQERIK